MAEARSAVGEPIVHALDEEESNSYLAALNEFRRSTRRRFFRTRNQIKNGMWPTSWWNLGVTVALVSIVIVTDLDIFKGINRRLWAFGEYFYITNAPPYFYLKVLILSWLFGIFFFIIVLYVRRYLLRLLLAYKGWLYEPPTKQSWITLLWGAAMRLITGPSPSTFSCQQSLPRMPVPCLPATIRKFMKSIKPLVSQEQYEQFKREGKEFEQKVAPKLQNFLHLKSWWAQNYVTDWWEKYVYLMNRSPIHINCNYYGLDNVIWKPTEFQCARAGAVAHMHMCFKRLLEREQLPAMRIRNTISVCMSQYERAYGTTRIPGEEIDDLVHVDSSQSKHIVVMRKGIYYKVDMMDKKGQLLSPKVLEGIMEWIIEDADKQQESESATAGANLAALTALKRADWAKIRKEYLLHGVNRESMEKIEKAAFVLTLETVSPESMEDRSRYMIGGNGTSMWFDKSLSLCFFANARYGFNAEHSWADAPVVAHMQEFCMTEEVLGDLYDKEGHCKDVVGVKQATYKLPSMLVWEVNEPFAGHIERARNFAIQNNSDLDLCVEVHEDYGKGFIKKCKVSPDAYIQIALQLAYYKDAGKFALTYEASMTRLYRMGRTETVRSLTPESCQFVKGMVEDNRSDEEKVRLLHEAAKVHVQLYKDSMSGRGVDRHLFALYVLCKGFNQESDFLHHALTMPWTLSTSQTPQQQMPSSPKIDYANRDKACPGGGFGPVSDEGYGISYMFPEESMIFFHVSSKKSSPLTDSRRMQHNICEALADMKKLFQSVE
ncbi:carnitine O-palmitoyltransferase 1, liver isoform-like [Anneissia japonica]|uniref:carnitine O-palmitoyltransferase 1, liver isoform-like n=1 Tax=Anneissia japonica TaxID=1529436 RepID=UPI001425901A|nr:carnitine O-palmitoyltransferase 1, liver isoform-like [Anneissia japonica]